MPRSGPAEFVSCTPFAPAQEIPIEPIPIDNRVYRVNAHGFLIYPDDFPKYYTMRVYLFDGGAGKALNRKIDCAGGFLYTRLRQGIFCLAGSTVSSYLQPVSHRT